MIRAKSPQFKRALPRPLSLLGCLLVIGLLGAQSAFGQFEIPGQERSLTSHADKKAEERIKDYHRRISKLDDEGWKREMNIVWFEAQVEPESRSIVLSSERALGFSGKDIVRVEEIDGDTPRYRLTFKKKKMKFKFGAPGRPEIHESVTIGKGDGAHLLIGHHNNRDGSFVFKRQLG